MKMNVLVSTMAMAAASLSMPAHAQSNPFTGPWVMGIVGLDSVEAELGGQSGSTEDFLFGAAVGYDLDLGGVILGGEAELSDSSVSESASDIVAFGDTLTVAADRDIYVGARLGVPVAPEALLYAKGGYTNAKIKGIYDDGAGTRTRDSETIDGFRLGAGAEFIASGNFLLRVEYRYSDYGDLSAGGFNTGIGVSRHQGVVGFGLRF